jgi:hypothetical protein
MGANEGVCAVVGLDCEVFDWATLNVPKMTRKQRIRTTKRSRKRASRSRVDMRQHGSTAVP